MRRNHYAPVTAADYVDAILADAADALAYAESIRPAWPARFNFFGKRTAETPETVNRPRIGARVAAVVLVAAATVTGATAAHADPTPAGAGDPTILAVVPAATGNGLQVVLSNGAWDMLRPCRTEDGRHCYWLAGARGNGRGRDFLVTRGHVYYWHNLAAVLPRSGGAR